MRVALKFYACVGSNHTTLDALRLMEARHPFGPGDIDRITVHGSRVTVDHVGWRYEPQGLTSAHLKRMRLERLGSATINGKKLRETFPGMKPGIVHAINQISISNGMHVGPKLPARAMPPPMEPRNDQIAYRTMLGLATILAD